MQTRGPIPGDLPPPPRATARRIACAFVLAAALLGVAACAAEKPAPPPAPKAQTAQLEVTREAYSGVDIHCVDGREVDAFLGLKLPPGAHKVVVSYSVCGANRNCTDFFGELGFTAAAGVQYRVEGKLPVNATTAQLTVVNAKDGKAVAGPFPGQRNVMSDDPKQYFHCAPRAAG